MRQNTTGVWILSKINLKGWAPTIVGDISANGSATTPANTCAGLNDEMECYAAFEQGGNQNLQGLANVLNSDSGKPFEQLDKEPLELAKQNHDRN